MSPHCRGACGLTSAETSRALTLSFDLDVKHGCGCTAEGLSRWGLSVHTDNTKKECVGNQEIRHQSEKETQACEYSLVPST